MWTPEVNVEYCSQSLCELFFDTQSPPDLTLLAGLSDAGYQPAAMPDLREYQG